MMPATSNSVLGWKHLAYSFDQSCTRAERSRGGSAVRCSQPSGRL